MYRGEAPKAAWGVRGSFAEETRSELSPEGQVGVTHLVKLKSISPQSKHKNNHAAVKVFRGIQKAQFKCSKDQNILSPQKSHRGRTQDGSGAMGLHEAARP